MAESDWEALADHHKLSEEAQAVLHYLYLLFRTAPDRLIEKVKRMYPNFTEQQLRVYIQRLRYGILIASIQGRSGYKIPDRLEDIAGFSNRYLNNIVPMINRINICNRKLVVKSLQEVDMLQANFNYSLLHELIKTLNR